MTNSQIPVVAAMVIGREYNAITGIALGLDRGSRRGVREGLRALTAGFAPAIAITLRFALPARGASKQSTAFELVLRPVPHVIDTPDFFSVAVAGPAAPVPARRAGVSLARRAGAGAPAYADRGGAFG
ncbi:hypothetical protein ACF08M_11715 [Streptomyces sp. NPDC015032]|uniref:hypothetical protein n=1 Tax=Streptomyces sp. NPDC015032 TaxID=3364937 RepID=UPI0036F86774